MPETVLVDECGNGMLVRRTPKRGIVIPIIFNEDIVDNFPNFKVREDDIYQISYPKAGCHWSWEILRLMLLGLSEESSKIEKEAYMVENNQEKDLDAMPSPRILNHHLHYADMPMQFIEKRAKVVYVYRNIKDIAVSFYHHHTKISAVTKYHATFSQFLKRFAAGQMDIGGDVFEYIRGWDEALLKLGSQAIVLCYEDMKKDIMTELRRLATFLCVEVDTMGLQKIAELTDFQAMQARMKKVGHESMIDKDGNHMMYRKGQVGDWKNYFTVAESEWYDRLIKERLGKLTFHKFKYE